MASFVLTAAILVITLRVGDRPGGKTMPVNIVNAKNNKLDTVHAKNVTKRRVARTNNYSTPSLVGASIVVENQQVDRI